MGKLSPTLESILADAADDASFRTKLLEDRMSAVEERGYQMTETERAVLASVSHQELEGRRGCGGAGSGE